MAEQWLSVASMKPKHVTIPLKHSALALYLPRPDYMVLQPFLWPSQYFKVLKISEQAYINQDISLVFLDK